MGVDAVTVRSDRPVELSAFVPLLESLGLWVVDQDVDTADGRRAFRFGVRWPTGPTGGRPGASDRLADALVALHDGAAIADPLNRLVLDAGLRWSEVALLRALARWWQLAECPFGAQYVNRVVVDHAGVAADLVALLAARLHPSSADEAEADAARARLGAACDGLATLDQDRILRGLWSVAEAVLRTDRWLGDAAAPRVAVKLDPALVPGVRAPVPYREIFVHSPSMEGVHLRWGPIARGGLRWSDRLDDYRSEVLGLMRAQVLKNALIVPTGAKGGFVLHNGAGPEAVRTAYVDFVDSLLALTDNLNPDGTVEPVPGRADGDDPYLVVAADRGTATFSDTANAVAASRSFWLGDAFASGGSHGYDHKALGITARGAWLAVRRHFRELGIDVQTEPITVAGIGDMSGDVFGNGLLRSQAVQLVAAFDHRHVFLDPAPDATISFAERRRLFDLPGSSWADYDRATLGPGGMVVERSAKAVSLTPEVRALLRIPGDPATVTPPELVRAVLTAPVDLLFAGGIGTYVAATGEVVTDDRANAEVRVAASALRARVVAEGANLAVTQPARVEYARRGGRIDSDAIDNAAGVAISDAEVNLKILFALAVSAGRLTEAERDERLTEATPDVVASVLEACRRQHWALSREQAASPANMGRFAALIDRLDAEGVVNREVEHLPPAAAIDERTAAGAGLTRPELAVLLAATKRWVAAALVDSTLPDDPATAGEAVAAFPAGVVAELADLVPEHRLRRELIASRLANRLVDRMGIAFVATQAAAGRSLARVATAWFAAEQSVGADAWFADVAALDDLVDTDVLLEAERAVLDALAEVTDDHLRRDEPRPALDLGSLIVRDTSSHAAVASAADLVDSPTRHRVRTALARRLRDAGAPAPVVDRLAGVVVAEVVVDAADLARATDRDVVTVATVALAVADGLGIERLVDVLGSGRIDGPDDEWTARAHDGLRADLDECRRFATLLALEEASPGAGPDQVTRAFLAERADGVADAQRLVRSVCAGTGPVRLDAVGVAVRAIRLAVG